MQERDMQIKLKKERTAAEQEYYNSHFQETLIKEQQDMEADKRQIIDSRRKTIQLARINLEMAKAKRLEKHAMKKEDFEYGLQLARQDAEFRENQKLLAAQAHESALKSRQILNEMCESVKHRKEMIKIAEAAEEHDIKCWVEKKNLQNELRRQLEKDFYTKKYEIKEKIGNVLHEKQLAAEEHDREIFRKQAAENESRIQLEIEKKSQKKKDTNQMLKAFRDEHVSLVLCRIELERNKKSKN
jgi:hypothetical protein